MSYKYAILNDDASAVVEYRTYPNPLNLETCKRLADGSPKVRPVVVNITPPNEYQVSRDTVSIGDDVVTISNVLEDLPEAQRKLIHNKIIDDQILEIEQQALRLGLLRTVMEDLQDRSISLAAASGISEAQLLDQNGPYYSPPYAKLHENIKARAVLRAQRV